MAGEIRHVAIPSSSDLRLARAAVRAALTPTPLIHSERIGVHLKLETFQPMGAFKARGNLAAMSRIPSNELIVTSSAGNHALGAAWAAERLGRRLRICVPGNASPAKLTALERFKVEVDRVGTSFDDAEARSLELAADGGHYLSSYNDTALIAGVSTLGNELEDLGQPLTVFCPVGGGGIISGLCMWAHQQPQIRLIGVESAVSLGMSTAVRAGRIVPITVGETIADGLAGNIEPGSVTFTIAKNRVDDFVAVTDDEIRDAIRFLSSEHGLVAEGAGAAAVAAVLAEKVKPTTPAVAIVTGRNIALPLLASVLESI